MGHRRLLGQRRMVGAAAGSTGAAELSISIAALASSTGSMLRGIDRVRDTTIRTCNRDLATPINGLVEIGKDWEPVAIVRTWPIALNAPTAANGPIALGQQTGGQALAGRPAIAWRATARRGQGTQGPVVARRTAELPEPPVSGLPRAAAAGRGSRAARRGRLVPASERPESDPGAHRKALGSTPGLTIRRARAIPTASPTLQPKSEHSAWRQHRHDHRFCKSAG